MSFQVLVWGVRGKAQGPGRQLTVPQGATEKDAVAI